MLFFMPSFYHLNAIRLGDSTQSGHIVYKKAIYRDSNGCNKRIVLKLNKTDNSALSRLEVAFNGLAERFLQPHLTSPQALVDNQKNDIVGVASDHLFYQVEAREGLLKNFFTIKKEGFSLDITPKTVCTAEEIPLYFLDQFPPGFFANLSQLDKESKLTLDMDSLASMLTSSYTLEEDDLHKGNIGFYVVEKEGKPHVVFMKIDHDLIMSDSIMSHFRTRLFNWRHGPHAFEINADDLRKFPKLRFSMNHYWPTTQRYFTKPGDTRVYSDTNELNAFSSLGQNKAFERAKWRNFYKHTLIPIELISESLLSSYDDKKPVDRAQIAMITQAVVARQARLRAVLFSMPEFQAFIKGFSEGERQQLAQEIFYQVPNDLCASLSEELQFTMMHQKRFCEEGGIAPGDTPLHVAIRFGDYRYDETWCSFGHFANQPNSLGECPLDIALKRELSFHPESNNDIRSNVFLTVNHLLRQHVWKTPRFQQLSEQDREKIQSYRHGSAHLKNTSLAMSTDNLITVIGQIGEDHRLSLKMQKDLAIECVHLFIDRQQHNPLLKTMLVELKLALNGSQNNPPSPALQFISQLRSKLWIIRQIRGLLGRTGTLTALNELLSKTIKHYTQSASSCYFFPQSAFEEEPVLHENTEVFRV